MESPQSNTGLSTGLRVELVMSALEPLVPLVSSQSITITLRGTSEDFSAALATRCLGGCEMIVGHSRERQSTYVTLRPTT